LSSLRATLFGFQDKELLGQNVSILIPSPWKERHDSLMKMYHTVHSSNVVGKRRNLLAETKDHERISVSLFVTEMISSQLYHVEIDLIDPSIELVFTLTGDGMIESCNSSYVAPMLGYTGIELVYQSFGVLVPSLVSSGSDNNSLSFIIDSTTTAYDAFHKDGSVIKVSLTFHSFHILDVEMISCRMHRHSSSPTHLVMAEQVAIPELTLGPVIGRGSYGVVRLGSFRSNKLVAAVKLLQKNAFSPTQLSRLQCEIAILKKMEHANIPRFLKVFDSHSVIGLVMEYCGGGTLGDYVKCRSCLQEEEARHYFRQLVSVVSYIHSLHVIHRDIKTENILMMMHREWQHSQVKLCDFGLSTFTMAETLHSTFCGTPAYAAPEMILSQAYEGPSVDVWSLSIVLHEMLVGNVPFESVASIIGSSYVAPLTVSDSCANLMMHGLERDTKLRITMEQLSQHVWLNVEVSDTHCARSNNTQLLNVIPSPLVFEIDSKSAFIGQVLGIPSSSVFEIDSKSAFIGQVLGIPSSSGETLDGNHHSSVVIGVNSSKRPKIDDLNVRE
jgi:serine/threonine protein kinase